MDSNSKGVRKSKPTPREVYMQAKLDGGSRKATESRRIARRLEAEMLNEPVCASCGHPVHGRFVQCMLCACAEHNEDQLPLQVVSANGGSDHAGLERLVPIGGCIGKAEHDPAEGDMRD